MQNLNAKQNKTTKFNFTISQFYILAVGAFLILLFLFPGSGQTQVPVPAQKTLPTSVEVPPELQDPPKSSIPNEDEPVDESATRKRKYLTLTVGIDHTENLADLDLPTKDIDVKGDYTKIVDISVDSNNSTVLHFSPTNQGVASVTLLDKATGKVIFEFRVDVRKINLDKAVREIKALLADIEGITIKIMNNKIIIDGQLLLPRDNSRIGNVLAQYADVAVSLVSLSPLAQKKIAELIERDINNPEINVRAVNERFILEGIANSKDEHDRAIIIANTYLPDTMVDPAEEKAIKRVKKTGGSIIDLIVVREPPPPAPGKTIQVVVHYVELAKDYTKNFHFQWSPSLTDKSQLEFGMSSSQSTPNSIFSSIVGIIDSLIPKLTWMTRHGHGRILESTTILVEEGNPGSMSSDTLVPFNTVQANGVVVPDWKPVGINTKVTPTIGSKNSDSIKLNLEFRISQLVDASGNKISQTQVNTVVTVRSGQSAAVSGLITNNTTNGYNVPDGSERNPIIMLLRSKSFARNQSQFVVFVTPVIKSSSSAGVEKVKKKFRLRD